ncbi:hypothetical protein J3459_011349 [Metarhizium acridum]|nr:hypothetical protein J3459_011349 [Metarhizium acridum]
MQQVRWKTGRDGRKRKVLVTRVLREAKGRTFEKGLAQRLKRLNVQIVCAPLGMARQRENSTTLNRRTGRINWQVEWLVVGGEKETVRSLSKVMDDVPLFQAYSAILEEKVRAETGSRKQRAWEVQSWTDSRWNLGLDCMQDPVDGKWTSFPGGASRTGLQRRRRSNDSNFGFSSRTSHTVRYAYTSHGAGGWGLPSRYSG